MKRVRLSTTVDAERLAKSRRLFKGPDSHLIDRALQALIEEMQGAAELRALEKYPYESDPELAWEVSEGPSLPYDGKVPKKVQALARARRRRR